MPVTSPVPQSTLSGNFFLLILLVFVHELCVCVCRPSGGVFSQVAGLSLAGAQAETNVIGIGQTYGSLSVPANGFMAGDTYALKIGGRITCDNNDVFTLRLRSNFGQIPSPIFAEFPIQVDGAKINGWWEVECEFIVQTEGGAGVAAMSTNAGFHYFNSTNVSKGIGVDNTEQTNFDTTVQNTLALTYETAEVSITEFRISQVSLTKLY